MPYLVWIDLSGPDTQADDELASAQVPELVLELVQGGWEVTAPVLDDDDEEDEEGPELLDVRVLGYPAGVFVGLAVDTDSIDVATALGASLGRHLRDAAPALMGWTVDSLRVDKATGPDAEGNWFPLLRDEPRPRFPVAEHLAWDLQRLCAQYLIGGAVRHLIDPTLRPPRAIDAADVVAGASTEHPWDRELAGALGGLLIAAGRVEHELGIRGSIVGRGEGDPGLAQALVDAVRREIDTPSTEHDDSDEDMRGHAVLDRFMTEHQLTWQDTADGERRSRQQFRALLWAGLRALATMTHSIQGEARSPWMWLATLDDSPVVGWLAEQDDEELELSDEDEHSQIAAAARAHLLVRVALLHPSLLDPSAAEHGRLGLDDIDSDPLHHLYADAVLDLGVEAVEAALPAAVGDALLPALRAVEAEADDAIDDLYQVLEGLLADDDVLPALGFLAEVALAAGPAKVAKTTRLLLNRPAELACVMVDRDDQDVDAVLRRFLVALSCAVSVEFAAELAGELPELTSADPRDEPALRHEAVTWLGRIIEADSDPAFHTTVLKALDLCPAPGSDLLAALGQDNPDPVALSAPMSTSELTVGVVQALSALSLTARAPWLPLEFLVE
ncbi:hypothetical protein [Kutzneria sp. NPDC052558]|uniref:hypothetical protein n=1 Tax=Kutzneria sp. NPDC052558 TaxID=3364121 RepID=UPI0037CB452D